MHVIALIIFGLLLLPGMVTVFIPFFPTFWYLLAVAGVFLLYDGWNHISPPNLLFLFIIFLLSIVVDWSAGLLGAKFGGATWKSLLLGFVGSMLGLIVFPPLG